MSKITTEIQRINRAKSALRETINAKGGTLSVEAKIDEYAGAVRGLPSGTMTPIKLKNGNNFSGWSLMTELPPIDASELTIARSLVQNCSSLQSLTLDLPQCTNATALAQGCSSLTSLTLSLPQCTNARYMAYGCSSLQSLTLDLPQCTDATALAQGCSSLTSLTLSLPQCTNLGSLTTGCPNLVECRLSGLKASLSLNGNTKLSLESVKYIVDNAQEAMEGAILTLPRALESKLPDETMEMAIEKGFEVAFR